MPKEEDKISETTVVAAAVAADEHYDEKILYLTCILPNNLLLLCVDGMDGDNIFDGRDRCCGGRRSKRD